jgi:hypothetical protein
MFGDNPDGYALQVPERAERRSWYDNSDSPLELRRRVVGNGIACGHALPLLAARFIWNELASRHATGREKRRRVAAI